MGNWNFVELEVIGEKKDVNAFNRISLELPVLRDYVIEKIGKPVEYAMYEEMAFKKPHRWRKHWWHSYYIGFHRREAGSDRNSRIVKVQRTRKVMNADARDYPVEDFEFFNNQHLRRPM